MTQITDNDARAIEELRARLGSRLTIVCHHYQREEAIRHCDIRGDSLELARRVPGIDADHIVFSWPSPPPCSPARDSRCSCPITARTASWPR